MATTTVTMIVVIGSEGCIQIVSMIWPMNDIFEEMGSPVH